MPNYKHFIASEAKEVPITVHRTREESNYSEKNFNYEKNIYLKQLTDLTIMFFDSFNLKRYRRSKLEK